MTKLVFSIALLALALAVSGDEFGKYRAVQSYEVKPGILATPTYSVNEGLCEVSFERRHYSVNGVDFDATMSREEVDSLFDVLAPAKDRGGPGWGLPSGTEYSEGDGGMVDTRIFYQNVTLAMFRFKDKDKFLAAVVSWKKPGCTAK